MPGNKRPVPGIVVKSIVAKPEWTKVAEVERFEMTPHPVEFEIYYSQ